MTLSGRLLGLGAVLQNGGPKAAEFRDEVRLTNVHFFFFLNVKLYTYIVFKIF